MGLPDMQAIEPAKPTLPDKVRGWFSSGYAARSAVERYIAAMPRTYLNSARRGSQTTRVDASSASQPFGGDGSRTMTYARRRNMVKTARRLAEDDILAGSILDRSTDNIIGTGMVPQAKTEDPGWNEAVEALWREYGQQIDPRGLVRSHGAWQRAMFRAHKRDGDIGGVLLKTGAVQTIEGDYVRSPRGGGDVARQGGPEIIDGVEINASGRPVGFHLAKQVNSYITETQRIDARNFVWYANTDRLDRTAVRGVSDLASMGWLFDQINGTVEAVTIAYRMAAMQGMIEKRPNPAAAFSGLPTAATNADGNEQPERVMEPGMWTFASTESEFVQVKPEHPTQSFESYMGVLFRMAGLKFGLPLELVMLDFSKTNYSSARASMEQAYRRFRIEQMGFADSVLNLIYRWRVSKWIKERLLPERDDAWKVQWLGQEWPYLDPQKEAVGTLVAIDAGLTTWEKECHKRNLEPNDVIESMAARAQAYEAAGVPLVRSGMTRDVGAQPQTPPNGDTDDDAETDDE